MLGKTENDGDFDWVDKSKCEIDSMDSCWLIFFLDSQVMFLDCRVKASWTIRAL